MAKTGGSPSTLFRSLKPDEESVQVSASAAAREAEQRWPLFKAVSPRKQEPTPVLSPQERVLWGKQERPNGQARKPALSVPGVSNKLAASLNRMGGRAAQGAVASAPLRAERESPLQDSMRGATKFAAEPTAGGRGLPFSKAHASEPVEEAEMTGAIDSDDSLANLFSRLEGKEQSVGKPAGKRPSFLGRLGRR